MEICVAGALEKERYFGAATAQLHRCTCPVATLCFVSLLHWQKKEKKGKDKKRKGKERKKIGEKEKIDYLTF
jgi:hypothetical protein